MKRKQNTTSVPSSRPNGLFRELDKAISKYIFALRAVKVPIRTDNEKFR